MGFKLTPTRACIFVLAALVGARAAAPEDAVLRPGVPLFDTDGNRLYAGGANLFLDGGVFYLVGEGRKTLPSACSECLNLYSSVDLASWKFEACVLHNKDVVASTPPNPVYRMERPKIFRCPSNNRLTMWFHCDLTNFGMQSVGVLTADAIAGPWTFAAPCFKPDGRASYDMGTFVDDGPHGDGRAYLVRSVENTFAGISQMTDDCLNVTGIVSQGPDMEGQAIMRDDAGVLHLLGSHLTGWAPNAAQFVTSPNASLVGAQWANNVNPSGDPTTYDSQSTFIFPFAHADGHHTQMAMLDRWNSGLPGPSGIDNMCVHRAQHRAAIPRAPASCNPTTPNPASFNRQDDAMAAPPPARGAKRDARLQHRLAAHRRHVRGGARAGVALRRRRARARREWPLRERRGLGRRRRTRGVRRGRRRAELGTHRRGDR